MAKRVTIAIRARSGSTIVYPLEGGDRIDEQIGDAIEVRLRIDEEPACRLCGEPESSHHQRTGTRGVPIGATGHRFELDAESGSFEEFVLNVTHVRRISGRSTDYDAAEADTIPGMPVVDIDPTPDGTP